GSQRKQLLLLPRRFPERLWRYRNRRNLRRRTFRQGIRKSCRKPRAGARKAAAGRRKRIFPRYRTSPKVPVCRRNRSREAQKSVRELFISLVSNLKSASGQFQIFRSPL